MTSLARRAVRLALVAGALAIPSALGQSDGPLVDGALTTVDGERVDLADGRAVTELVVVASWCDPCEREVAGLRRRLGTLRRAGYRAVLVGVSRRQSSEQFANWARGLGFSGPLVYDGDGSLEKRLGAQLLPWHVVVDREGKTLHRADQAPGEERLRSWTGS